eukprot:TRINITY_DN35065_c0_g1_i1.p1 TRINITY_DN35065_c0_g1~~TRINITY_DN35065_c0_g1_i1.p1  ORF type:complete len:410 (-),score=22.68 TRINITY_DN35065_c0_g1_i1:244-1473(-)
MSDPEPTQRRRDEADALSAIFGDDFIEISNNEWHFTKAIKGSDSEKVEQKLVCYLPDDYPHKSPPVAILECCSAGFNLNDDDLCSQWLEHFTPNEEFGLTLAELFFAFCDSLAVSSDSAGYVQSSVTNPRTISDVAPVSHKIRSSDEQNSDGLVDSEIDIIVQLPHARGVEIANSLRNTSGFEVYGETFVNGEFGVAVELLLRPIYPGQSTENLDNATAQPQSHSYYDMHLSVDGLETDDVRAWVDSISGISSSPIETDTNFGATLLKWAEQQRVRQEAKEGYSADGVGDDVADTLCGHSVKLTGNAAWKARLQAGETVAFRGGGNSLHPRIKSGECCQYAPVKHHDDVKEKDIVFCQIKGRYWGHMVKKKTFVGGKHEYEYTISNIHGWENGTIPLDNVYGKVIDHWK